MREPLFSSFVLSPMSDMAWTREMRKVVSELRRGAKEYSEEEIDQLVDEAVSAVRSEKRPVREKIEA